MTIDDLAIDDKRLLTRLALLTRSSVDLPFGEKTGLRIVGFIIDADEFHSPADGIFMMDALQRAAGIDLTTLGTGIEDRVRAPYAIPPYRPEPA